jgi:hypothetical protein
LRPIHGDDPQWRIAVPMAAGVVRTPAGERWFGPLDKAKELWLEAVVGPRGPALVALLGELLRSDSEAAQLSQELVTRYEEIDLLYTINEVLGHTVRLESAA